MSRPAGKKIMSAVDSATSVEHNITEGEGLFVVLYKGDTFNYNHQSWLRDEPPKYKRTVFVNKGHAFKLAEKLNEKFNTKSFTVHQISEFGWPVKRWMWD